jgi:3-deoxy-7-phosphoheptulonate synthase
MIVIMEVGATQSQVANVATHVQAMGLSAHIIEGQERTIVAVVGDERSEVDRDVLTALEGVERMMPVLAPYKIAGREVHPANTVIALGSLTLGEQKVMIAVGPRAVETREQYLTTAKQLQRLGVDALLGSLFGSRESPYVREGMGGDGLDVLVEAHNLTDLPVITEVDEPEGVAAAARFADVLLINGHSMQNYALLKAVGQSQHTAILKRGAFNTMEELLMAAEYILSYGNRRVVLCESGIRTSDAYTRNTTFDVNAVAVLKSKTHLPIVVDVGRAAGRTDLVAAIAGGAVAAGADGLLLEIEDDPDAAARPITERHRLNLAELEILLRTLKRIAGAVNRTL